MANLGDTGGEAEPRGPAEGVDQGVGPEQAEAADGRTGVEPGGGVDRGGGSDGGGARDFGVGPETVDLGGGGGPGGGAIEFGVGPETVDPGGGGAGPAGGRELTSRAVAGAARAGDAGRSRAGPGAARRRDVRGVSRILPDLDDDLLLQLFYKGARSQWTSADLDTLSPVRLSPRQRQALARLLTPIYFGEQTAMAGASAILPTLMQARETSAQLYLASFIMDEARHFEVLTRLYRALECDPLGLRDLPELLQYHHRLRQGDRMDWVWGILFSDLVGKHFYRAFAAGSAADAGFAGAPAVSGASSDRPARAIHDPVLASLSTRVLQDEARHLAFAEHYLRRNLASAPEARRRALLEMRDQLFHLLEAMTERVRADAAELELDADAYLGRVWTDVEAFGARIGLTAPPPAPPNDGPTDTPNDVPTDTPNDDPPGDLSPHLPHADDEYHTGRHADRHAERHAQDDFSMARHADAAAAIERHTNGDDHTDRHVERHAKDLRASQNGLSTSQNGLSACFGCVLALMCSRRLAVSPS